MKATAMKAYVSLAIASGVVGGALSLWLIQESEARKFEALKAHALCVLELPMGTATVSAAFSNNRSIEMFHVALKTRASDETFSVSISGERGPVASASGVKAGLFGLGTRIEPGNYTVTVRQQTKAKDGTLVVADAAPVYVSGWQIWSRTYVGLLAFSAVCVVLTRKAEHSRKRALSLAAFHSLLLGFLLIFVYLLFHEGGHALAQIAFGHFDLAQSDFWGIHGHPHSGAIFGPQLKPWQQTVISCAGPMLPTLSGFGLFVLWGLPLRRKLRSLRPMLNLYFSATVAMLVFSEAVCGPGYLLGFITAEGDLVRRVTEAGGPLWLVKTLLWVSFLFCGVILWRVVPEAWKAWKTCFLKTPDAALAMNSA